MDKIMDNDMVVRYIFRHMRITESRLDAMSNALAKQVKFNKNTKRFAIWGTIMLVGVTHDLCVHRKQLAKLERRVEELEVKEDKEE